MATNLSFFTIVLNDKAYLLLHTYTARLLWIRYNSIGTILDVACAEGFVYNLPLEIAFPNNVILTANPIENVTYLDILNWPKILKERGGREHYEQLGISNPPKLQNFIQADAQALPFRDKSFDTLNISETLEHPLDPVQVLKEAKRVARQRILVTVPDEESWIYKRVFRHFGILDSIEHVRLFNAQKLKKYFDEAGLTSYQIHHVLFGMMEYYVAIISL